MTVLKHIDFEAPDWGELASGPIDVLSFGNLLLSHSPELYWRLGEAAGATVNDDSGNGRAGAYSNTPTLGQAGALAYDSDTAVQFAHSSSEYAQADAYQGVTGTSARTLLYLYKGTGGGTHASQQPHFGWGTGDPGALWMASVNSNAGHGNNGAARIGLGSGYRVGTTLITDNAWHFIAWTCPASGTMNDVKLYVDGAAESFTGSSGSATINTGGTNVRVARWPYLDEYASGTIDECAGFSTELTAAQILDLWRAMIGE